MPIRWDRCVHLRWQKSVIQHRPCILCQATFWLVIWGGPCDKHYVNGLQKGAKSWQSLGLMHSISSRCCGTCGLSKSLKGGQWPLVTSDSKLLYAETKESKCLDNICLGSPPHWKTDEAILLRQCIWRVQVCGWVGRGLNAYEYAHWALCQFWLHHLTVELKSQIGCTELELASWQKLNSLWTRSLSAVAAQEHMWPPSKLAKTPLCQSFCQMATDCISWTL